MNPWEQQAWQVWGATQGFSTGSGTSQIKFDIKFESPPDDGLTMPARPPRKPLTPYERWRLQEVDGEEDAVFVDATMDSRAIAVVP